MKKKLLKASSGKLLGNGSNIFYILPDTRAIRAVKAVEDLEVSFDPKGPHLEITFEPITDQKLLQAINNGETEIRIQLLIHQQTADSFVNGTVLIPASEFPERTGWSDTYDPKRMARRRSCDLAAEDCTWHSLTPYELTHGNATLEAEGGNVFIAANQGKTCSNVWMAIEMYVPAFGPGTSDQFQYVREKNAHKISNVIAVPKEYVEA